MLVGVFAQHFADSSSSESLEELRQLTETAKVEVLDVILQNRVVPDPKYVVGKGKLQELKARLSELGGNVVIFDHELSGSQVRNLEWVLDVKIIDRTQLILDIFAQRARTREGKLQVELAQLSYMLPRLSGHYSNLSRLGGGIGTRGPGETKLEADRRHIRARIQEVKNQLAQVSRHRSLYRSRRTKNGVIQIALVGYTNAGKSTLLHKLTNADSYIEDQLFATLDPTSKTMTLPSGLEVIVTDTVGFIQRLPHTLVAAFRSTLEEVCEADLIIHVVDGSTKDRDRHIQVVHEVLHDLGAHHKDQLLAFNKMDLLQQTEPEGLPLTSMYAPCICISALKQNDIHVLKERIQQQLLGNTKMFQIPASRGDLQALVHQLGEVLNMQVEQNHMVYSVRIHEQEYRKHGYKLKEFETGREDETTT